jgi:hypothetical protein
MVDQPLQPFSPPSAVLAHLPFNLSTGSAVAILLGLVFVFWAVYTIVAIYHWLRYSHASAIAYPAIAAHLIVSFFIASFILTGAL